MIAKDEIREALQAVVDSVGTEILQAYRDEMKKIEEESEEIEDIVDVLPFIKRLKEENEELKKENAKNFKYAEMMGDIDGDQFSDLLHDYGWDYNEKGELVRTAGDEEWMCY